MHQQNKLKVLMCSEASFVNSGFGNYTRELLNRLYDTNKYEIAEFASYGVVNDPRDQSIRWKYYANAVREGDQRYSEYSSRSDNQFGRWRFDKVLLDFKPNVVIDIRDYWMNSYQSFSPLRPYFNWVLMPTVDSAPQQEQWIDTFLNTDAIFTYSDWGAEVLKNQSAGKINYINTASPGVDLSTFVIKENKEEIKQKFGLPPNSFVIGSVMRNQKRKLIPELLRTFRKLLDQLYSDGSPMADNTYLYLHTSYPDAGWDIPELLKENRLLNRVYFTYQCPKCDFAESNVFTHASKICKKCMDRSSRFTAVTNGVSNETLCEIYNMFDIYVQYAICEGFGMPQVEAGACGVPIATVDYSAMKDVIHKLEAYPISIKSYFKELETKAIRAYPDGDQLNKYIMKFMRLPEHKQKDKRKKTRLLTEKYYNWDNIAKIWDDFLSSPHLFKAKKDWDNPPTYLKQIEDSKEIDSKNYFSHIFDICNSKLYDINKMGSSFILDMCRDSDYGFSHNGASFSSASIKDTINNIKVLINNHNEAEKARSSNIKFNDDFIQYAHLKHTT
jgi:glycosyltransferase involved in cell wall biosynthesis